jgi:predicted TIM-barrel fold metal-dependent hydrolase
MVISDAQVHAYERDHPGRPWAAVLHGPPEVTGDQMVSAMDAVGVDGALLVSPFTMYRYDASYAIEVYAAHPGRFALIKPVDPADPAAADRIAAWAATDGAVAVRIMMTHGVSSDPYNDMWAPLARIFDAFGFDRCMWGTDWTRAVALLTYKQGVDAFRLTDRLSDSDRAALMGATLQRVYDWSPSRTK